MNITIIIPHRPSSGGMNSVGGPLHQKDDFRWYNINEEHVDARDRDLGLPERAIRAINKNSFYKHKIVVGIDNDMTPHENWLKEYDNVTVFRASYISDQTIALPFFRMNTLQREAILSLPDDEMVAYGWLDDIICCKNWDRPIHIAHEKYGDDKKTYAGMFTEMRGPIQQITNYDIWVKWRNTSKETNYACCHCLTMPPLSVEPGYIHKEAYIDEFAQVATSVPITNDNIIVENCGDRIYGYFAALISKNSHLKEKVVDIKTGPGWDLDFESVLGTKIVCLNSFVIHSHHIFELDTIEVEHEVL